MSGSTRKVVVLEVITTDRSMKVLILKIHRGREIKMIPGERKTSPSTSVAQLLGNRARSSQLLSLSQHRESRRAMLMHMAHMGRWFDNMKRF